MFSVRSIARVNYWKPFNWARSFLTAKHSSIFINFMIQKRPWPSECSVLIQYYWPLLPILFLNRIFYRTHYRGDRRISKIDKNLILISYFILFSKVKGWENFYIFCNKVLWFLKGLSISAVNSTWKQMQFTR